MFSEANFSLPHGWFLVIFLKPEITPYSGLFHVLGLLPHKQGGLFEPWWRSGRAWNASMPTASVEAPNIQLKAKVVLNQTLTLSLFYYFAIFLRIQKSGSRFTAWDCSSGGVALIALCHILMFLISFSFLSYCLSFLFHYFATS